MISPRLQAFVEYFATAEPNAVRKIAYKHGYIPPQSLEGSMGFLYEFLMENEDEGLFELMSYHPDKDAILSTVQNTEANPAPIITQTSSLDGTVSTPVAITSKVSKQDNVAIVLIGILIIWYIAVYK